MPLVLDTDRGERSIIRRRSFFDSAILLYAGWVSLTLLLAAELIWLMLPFNAEVDLAGQTSYIELLVSLQLSLRPAFVTGVIATIFFSRDVVRDEFHKALNGSRRRVISVTWLGLHLAILAVMIVGTLARREGRLTSLVDWEWWLLLWIVLALAALTTWCFTAISPRFWTNWIRRSPAAFIGGAIVGFAAILVGDWARNLWWVLLLPTFRLVRLILWLTGQQTITDPSNLIVGTPRFAVSIGLPCSGIEGMGLISVFVVLFLWYRRHDLIFPRALLLLPMGLLAMWLLNGMRIAALVLIGNLDVDVAVKGFHSVAGWLLFNVVACGLAWMTTRLGLFIRGDANQADFNPSSPYLVPLLTLLALSMLIRAFAPNLRPSYAIEMIVVLIVIWLYRAELRAMRWSLSWLPVTAGAVVFALWILWDRSGAVVDAMMAAPSSRLATVPSTWMMIGLGCATIAVPIAEELAFRGYLARRLMAADFERTPFGRFGWLSFAGSSVACGILHRAWIPATIAGMIFAGAMYWRGLLSDAIIAHLTSCGLLFLFAAAIYYKH